MFNDAIGTHGAFDAEGTTTVVSEQSTTDCEFSVFGTYALISELVEDPYLDEEYTWLKIVKYMGYGTSCVFLLVFILVVTFEP